MDFYQSNSSHDRITRWLICDLRYTELFASRTLYLIPRARIEVASSTFSLLFLPFFLLLNFFSSYLSSQSDARSIDQQGFFPPCLHPFETSTALSARPCTVCILMETRCSIALKRNFFSWQVPGKEDGSLEWPFVIQWDTNHQGFTRVLCRVPRSKRYNLLSRKLLQITSFFLWFISSISKE